jgi:hypothetical protein
VNRRAALTGALLVTLTTPATWPLALAAFLLRGGFLLVTIPIVVLPTPVGLGNVLAPWITPLALGSITPAFLAVSVGAVVVVFGWLVIGGWAAAALEAEGARIVARVASGDRQPAGTATGAARIAVRIMAARILASVPLMLALALASVRLVWTAYLELNNPSDTSVSIVVRVVRSSPEVLVLLVLAWMVGEMVGAVAARRITLDREGISAALRRATWACLRHPLTTIARFGLPTLALIVVLVPSTIAAASAWTGVGTVLGDGSDLIRVLAAVALFVTVWIVGLALTAVVCAWRAAVWTMADVLERGTFGGSSNRRPGDWRHDPLSANV